MSQQANQLLVNISHHAGIPLIISIFFAGIFIMIISSGMTGKIGWYCKNGWSGIEVGLVYRKIFCHKRASKPGLPNDFSRL